ncbi:hypothetical protein Bca4012_011251 [Brassica carinata]
MDFTVMIGVMTTFSHLWVICVVDEDLKSLEKFSRKLELRYNDQLQYYEDAKLMEVFPEVTRDPSNLMSMRKTIPPLVLLRNQLKGRFVLYHYILHFI